jgi:hypothetical protein
MRAVIFFLSSVSAYSLLRSPALGRSSVRLYQTWQEEADQFLNIDTACDKRRDLAVELFKKSREILDDVVSAVQERDVKKIAPPELSYGKAVVGLQAVRRQIVNDILPTAMTKAFPKLIEEGPKIFQDILAKGPGKGRELIETVRDITQDPSMLQSTVDDIRREIRNVVKSTPEGLATPVYEVLKTSENYEIRKYAPYSVISTELTSGEEGSEMADPLASGNSFTSLAEYIFDEKLSMTTPVITGGGSMEFVLPYGLDATSAPVPKSSTVVLKDIPSLNIATLEFPGIATDGEVSRQRALLEDSLLADGIMYDNLSFKVYQYNPPYTLPWLRRNEVSVVIEGPIPNNDFVSKDESEFFTAPEAGD